MARLKKYKVKISQYRGFVADAFTAEGAKAQAWKSMSGRGKYKYGWKSRSEFMKNAKAEILR